MNTRYKSSKQLLDKVWRSLQTKDIKQAISSSNLLGRNFPDFAPGWYAASHVAQLIKQPGSALIAIDRALKLEPANIDWQIHRIGCLLMCADNKSSGEFLHVLLTNSSLYSVTQLSQLAFLCNRLEMHDDAAGLYQRLIRKEPKNSGHWFNLASIQRFGGQIELAEASLEKAIALNPEDFEAFELRSGLRKQTSNSNHIKQLEETLEKGINIPAGEVRVCYALAKELEDIGDTEQSFKALSRGATLRRKHINYNINEDLQTIEAIIDSFTPTLFKDHEKGSKTVEPIFILGLPRTGSTLVERILGSHSEVFAAGELNNFAIQMMQQVSKRSPAQQPSRLELVRQTALLDFEQLGKAYIDSSRPMTGSTTHFVDKMPLNFLYAGLIHLSLPNAKIIHMKRHPMDTCYAIYKRLFQDGYPWSYDIGEIASYYLAYHRLMTHWNNAMPGVIHELRYEDLVGDFDNQTRLLIEACNLRWEPQCLNFTNNAAATTTASAAQVRQAIYTSSVHRWHDYESQLAPLAGLLREGGVHFD